jgi:6-phosphogluconolactonase (cycloisomerase 2 family)
MLAETRAMKLRNFGTRLLAGASIAGLTLLLVSCGASNTVDFLYVTSNLQNPGQINVYEVDSESGQLYQLADSPYPAGGTNPVYEVASSNGLHLYVANHDSNTVVMFAIGTDGKLYPIQTTTTPGTEPVALAMNASGTALYVLDYYAPAVPGQPSYTDLDPGPGAVVVYTVDPTTGLLSSEPLANGTTNYWQVQCFPSNLTVTPNGNDVYVTNTNSVVVTTAPPVTGTIPTLPAVCPDYGTVSEFAVNSGGSGGAQTVSGLTPIGNPLPPLNTSQVTGIAMSAGSAPTGIASDPGGGSIYVTDSALNQVYSYAIQSNGALSLTATTPTGNMPMGAVVAGASGSPGTFLYVSNYKDGSISSYSLSAGVPTPITTTDSGTSGPLCLVIDPELGRFLYVSNYIGGKVGGAELNPANGQLSIDNGSPYVTQGQPTCVAAIGHNGKSNGL